VEELSSDGLRLAAHFTRPAGGAKVRAVVLLPGFPRGTGGAAMSGNTYRQLADQVAAGTGSAALTFNYRGTSSSEGDFSIEGWLADIRAAIDALSSRSDISGICLCGFRLGGTLAIMTAADDDRVRGVATFAAPASLRAWVRDPSWFLEYARRVGALRSADFPPDPVAWVRAISNLDPIAAAARVSPRPLLIVHGTRDEVVPADDARRLARAAPGRQTEVRYIQNGAHRLRHDPRAVAMLSGWLDRQPT
jgi:putative redox protein